MKPCRYLTRGRALAAFLVSAWVYGAAAYGQGISIDTSRTTGGSIRPGFSATCNSSSIGAIRANGADIEVCNGSAWGSLSGSATPGGVSGSIQFNSGGALAGRSDVVIDSGGRVGILTGSPSYNLDVRGNARIGAATGDARLEIGEGATGNRFAYVDLVGDTTYTDYGFRMLRANTGPNAWSYLYHRGAGNFNLITQDQAPIALFTSNTERMRVSSDGNVGIGTAAPSNTLHVAGGYIRISGFASPGMIVAPTTGSSYVFGANTALPGVGVYDNASSTWRLAIRDSTGNVGIGTITPDRLLDVNGNAKISTLRVGDVGHGTSWPGIANNALGDVGGQYALIQNSSGQTLLNAASGQQLNFRINNVDRMTLASGGNVGIGTTAPAVSLTVVGEVQVSNSGVACGASTAGAIRYTGGNLQFCNGSAFTGLATGTGITDGDKGDITVSGGGATWTIDSGAVSYAKIQNVSTNNRLLGRSTAGAGVVEELTVGSGLSLAGGTLSVSSNALDRITSSTTAAVIANQSGGTVSFTLGGVAQAAYLHPTLGLVGPGVSTTGNISATRVGVAANDSAAAPGYTWVGDTNTGIFWPAADTIGFTTNGTEAMRINSSNQVGIATAAPNAALGVVGTVSATQLQVNTDRLRLSHDGSNASVRNNTGIFLLYNAVGSAGTTVAYRFHGTTGNATLVEIRNDGGVVATAYYHSSDRNLKDNIATFSGGLATVERLRGVSFDWKDNGARSLGVIAQEVESILPSAVTTNENGKKAVDYSQLVAPMIEAIKELKVANDNLRSANDNLQAENRALQADVRRIKEALKLP